MAPGDRAAECLRLLDREQRLMGHRPMRDTEVVEQGEKVFGRCGHVGCLGRKPPRLQRTGAFGIRTALVIKAADAEDRQYLTDAGVAQG